MYRVLLKCFRSRDVQDERIYMRWEQDNDLQALGPLGLFQEYLSMGQFYLLPDILQYHHYHNNYKK